MNKLPIVAGNWKMNKHPEEGFLFVSEIQDLLLDINHVSVIFAPPFTGLFEMNVNPPFYSAAQNCHWENSGAFTGEISVSMIKDCGANYVIIGHSERRHIFKESDDWVNKKLISVINNGLNPILCVGETLDQRESGQTDQALHDQLEKGLVGIDSIKDCIIAYEPVWAIGTGLTAENKQIELAHKAIRDMLSSILKGANDFQILYGGSVNSGNAEDLIQVPGVDGFLIGGASLDVESFSSIARTVEMVQEKKI
jgi:triosephosphate isomerase